MPWALAREPRWGEERIWGFVGRGVRGMGSAAVNAEDTVRESIANAQHEEKHGSGEPCHHKGGRRLAT